MRYVNSSKALAGFLALAAAGCSGGSNGTAALHIRCADGASFCIVSCDLGCSQTGCSITEIAENQRLRFTFSSEIETASVNNSSVSIRTSSGVAPEGDLLVDRNVLSFVPRVRTVNGVSTFGFKRNETYIISMAGGKSGQFGLRNLAGDRLGRDFTCTVLASRGIVDEDQQAPRVELVTPEESSTAPRDPTVILRFTELIDTTPLRGTLTSASPIRFTLRTAPENASGGLTCNRDSAGLVLEGIPRLSTERVGEVDVTVVEFKPTVLLPGRACVEVLVTADLRDLSGRNAEPNRFEFFTVEGVPIPITIAEPFDSTGQLEVATSSGTWGGGEARPGLIGWDGRHGSFDYTPPVGTAIGASEYQIDTTSVTIPGANTLSGQAYTVTDGKFYFTDFVVPAGVTVNFVGPVPPQIWVRGQADVQGSLKLNGAPMTTFNARGVTSAPAPFVTGQAGGEPGAGGGRGGKGGDECQGSGPIIVNGVTLTNGRNGDDVRLLAGNGYAVQAIGTGGRGSAMNPPTGIAAPNSPLVGFIYRAFFAPGGGGGGFSGPGGTASVTPVTNLQVGPLPPGGTAFDIASFSSVGYSSLDHYTIAGSGGGGGATHAFGTIYIGAQDVYVAGSGGSGGGGALALRAGGDLIVGSTATLEARGGRGALIDARPTGGSASNSDWGVSSPGGGGSGGSFVLQAGGDLTFGGSIDTSGGDGSRTGQIGTSAINVSTRAGAGAPGFFRLEAGGTLNFAATSTVPAYTAGTHSGSLTDRDPFTGCTSKWYSTNQVFPPSWLRYELDVDTGNGTIVTFTDSGAPGTVPADNPNGPVVLQLQGAQLDLATGQPLPGTTGPWRLYVGTGVGPGIGLDSPTGFRFMLTFNRGLFPNCIVRALRVHAQT